ncbi:MAG TPA: hypothetical protein VFI54_13930 [Solirubrobacteraceae bacterium]|nr:hypothetical protein [Solirubrobacteraceae bacterium]
MEKKQRTPLDGAGVISAIVAALFGHDAIILREISPETLLLDCLAAERLYRPGSAAGRSSAPPRVPRTWSPGPARRDGPAPDRATCRWSAGLMPVLRGRRERRNSA